MEKACLSPNLGFQVKQSQKVKKHTEPGLAEPLDPAMPETGTLNMNQ